MTRISPVRKDDESTRNLILRSAIHHFSLYGYEGTSVRQLLSEQNLNAGLAHYYFGSKEKLYEAAIRFYADRSLADRKRRLKRWKAETHATRDQAVHTLLTAYCLPHFEIAGAEGGIDFARMASNMFRLDIAHNRSILDEVYHIRRLFQLELQSLLPGLTTEHLQQSLNALGMIMLAAAVEHAQSLVKASAEERNLKGLERASFCADVVTGGLFRLFANSPGKAS